MVTMTEQLQPDISTLPRCTTTAAFTLNPDTTVDDVGAAPRVVAVQCVDPTGHTGDHTMIDPNSVLPIRVPRAEADDDLVEWLLRQIATTETPDGESAADQRFGAAIRAVVELHGARGAHECPADGLAGVHVDFVTDCLTLRLLALPYADRPGYLQEWRP
jgi:hypothetical protein